MTIDKQQQILELVEKIPSLTEGQLFWMKRVMDVFQSTHNFKLLKKNGIFDAETLGNFGDALRIHHSFSMEPFSKDKFEYVLESVLKMGGHNAELAPKGNHGHDITINAIPVSLKTQADRGINPDKIWISKFMELGRGKWGDDPKDLIGLRNSFLMHIKNYNRVYILRTLHGAPEWFYELVEIPKSLLMAARTGELEMKMDSKQYPKPGYCHVKSPKGECLYQLYFDGGTERKLQLKNLLKSHCTVHATWKFTIPPE